jgi:hypothetical protein
VRTEMAGDIFIAQIVVRMGRTHEATPGPSADGIPGDGSNRKEYNALEKTQQTAT